VDWIDWQFLPVMSAGLGLGGGYVTVSKGSDMSFEQIQGRLTWRTTAKLEFQVSVGGDSRQVIDGGESSLLNPIYALTIRYKPFETTTLSLTGSRVVSASYFQGEITESTDISANLNQRLLKYLFLDVGGGYGFGSYRSTTGDFSTTREDNITHFTARLSTKVLKKGTIGVFYYFSENSSDRSAFSYTSSQVGVDLEYRF
jgi:hypothetical protein